MIIMSSSVSFEESKFMKDLIHLRDTQEAIQGFSAWCIKHRKAAYKIARCWLKVVKKVRVEQKLTLFYLLNDIVQHCRRKNYAEFLSKLESVIKEAMPHLKDERINGKLLRCIHIWSERAVFSEDFLSDMKAILLLEDKDSEEIDNFQPTQLCTQIKIMKALEDDTDYKLKTLKDSEINIMDIDSLRQTLKDRQDGNDFISDFEKSTGKMQDYIKAIDKELGKRRKVIELLSNGGKYYESLLGEANIVANAYTNFEKRLLNLKKKLDEKIPELERNPPPPVHPDNLSPIPSPDYDAPSPVNDEYELKLPGEDHYDHASLTNAGYSDKTAAPKPSLHSSNGSRDLNQRLNSMMSSNSVSEISGSSNAPTPTPINSSDKNLSISEFLTRLAEGKPVDNSNQYSHHSSVSSKARTNGVSSGSGNFSEESISTTPMNSNHHRLSAAQHSSKGIGPSHQPIATALPPMPEQQQQQPLEQSKWWANPPPPPPPLPPSVIPSNNKWSEPWNQEAEWNAPHSLEKNNLIHLINNNSSNSSSQIDMDVVDSDHEEANEQPSSDSSGLSLQDRLKNLAGMPISNNPPVNSSSNNPPPPVVSQGGWDESISPRGRGEMRGRPYSIRGRGGRGGFHFERGRGMHPRGFRGRW